MKSLHFDADALANDLVKECLIPTADDIMEDFVNDAVKNLHRFNVENVDYFVGNAIEEAGKRVTTQCAFMANAIMESYGTGNKMDTDNPALDWYKHSPYWNTLRDGTNKIVGRKKGHYVNILGEDKYSSGRMAGKPVPGDRAGTNAISNALKRLDQQLSRKLKEEATYYMSHVNYGKYFRFGE